MQENLALGTGYRRSEGHRVVSSVNKTVRKAEIISMNSLNIETERERERHGQVSVSEGWFEDKSFRF